MYIQFAMIHLIKETTRKQNKMIPQHYKLCKCNTPRLISITIKCNALNYNACCEMCNNSAAACQILIFKSHRILTRKTDATCCIVHFITHCS